MAAFTGFYYESRKGLLYHRNGEVGLLSMRIRMHEQRRCMIIRLEVQGTRVVGHKGPKVKGRTCALNDFEVANSETSPMRLMLGQFVSVWGCMSDLFSEYDNGYVDWLKRGSNRWWGFV